MLSKVRSQFSVHALGIVSLLAYGAISYLLERSDFWVFIALYSVLFLCYYLLIRSDRHHLVNVSVFFIYALLFRVIHFGCLPHLSDDFYRFIWDGLSIISGINPFQFTPREAIENQVVNESVLFVNMNSPDYYSVYPSVAQLFFALSALFLKWGLLYPVVAMRFLMLGLELSAFRYLMRLMQMLRMSKNHLLVYALNPLLILESYHSLHFEIVMISFLVLAFYFLVVNEKLFLASVYFALAVATKLLPIILLPILMKKIGLRKSILFSLSVLLVCCILFIPFMNDQYLSHFTSSLGLYFKYFEFNSSIYRLGVYLQNHLWWFRSWYFLLLGSGILGVLLYKVRGEKWDSTFMGVYLIYAVYLFFTRSLHPWYILPLFFYGGLSKMKMPILWTYLIGWTYITYQSSMYQQREWVIWVEYIVVLLSFFRDSKKLLNRRRYSRSNPLSL